MGYQFSVSDEEAEKIQKWKEEQLGLSCERWTYCFTPTTPGTAFVIKDCVTKEELDLTDYDSW